MPKYRKKPVTIEAVQFTEENVKNGTLKAFAPAVSLAFSSHETKAQVPTTLEGVMIASPGDWIIKGVKGEFYPCKPDIFVATCDPTESA